MDREIVASTPVQVRKASPYVGPRAIRHDEPFYGRETETLALIDKLLPGGTTLLHSPSGAGKTSLIQAAVVPWFGREGFQLCATIEPRFSALRVNLPPPDDLDVPNRYVFSLVNGLVGHQVDRHEAVRMTIDDALTRLAGDAERRQLVVIDQLEEALTLDRNDREGQRALFKQLGAALRRSSRWALLAIREDYLGELDRYRQFFPNELRSTFRLDFLDAAAARRAVQLPAAGEKVTFTDEAADRLVSDLRKVRATVAGIRTGATGDAAPEAAEIDYPYVEPVLLQVVCNNLWRILSREWTGDEPVITEGDLDRVRPYSMYLSKYYRAAVRKASDKDVDVEREIRDWIGRALLTKDMTRKPTRSLPLVPRAQKVVESLQDQYLVRDDPRPGGVFWELSHDMLVEAIVEDNRLWRLSKLRPWQIAAVEWENSGRERSFLLIGPDYDLARKESAGMTLNAVESAFLAESAKVIEQESRRARLEAAVRFAGHRISAYRVALGLSLVLNAVLAAALLLVFLTS
jgi:hypothetical protein